MAETATLTRGDHVTVERYPGIACWYIGVADNGYNDDVIVCMVGDDTNHRVHRDTVTALDRDDFCGECGQIGCAHG